MTCNWSHTGISALSGFVELSNPGTLEVDQLLLHYWAICTSIWHHRDVLGSFLFSSSALQCMKSFVWLTFLRILPMLGPFSPENESDTFSHRSVRITVWNIPPHLNTVCFHPFRCGHEQVNLIHDCRHTRRQEWQETDRWQICLREKWFSMKMKTARFVDHFEEEWHSCECFTVYFLSILIGTNQM